jgi:asparagine synthase (glutamine-hydrolysing)
MSGLIGSFHYQGNAQPLALAALRHPGPDSKGAWLSSDSRCWLGHSRLAIQDLSAAAQPITSHCGRITLVFNGIIYNHHQVRKSLRFQGWSGHNDNETLVEGLAQKGPAILLDLRGMFAFAAYDSVKQQLLLARDRLGIQPLYLSWQPQGVLFASERRSLPEDYRLNSQSITQMLAFGHDRTPAQLPGTETQGIVSMPAGLVVRVNHTRPHDPVRYWPPQPRPDWTPLPIRDSRWARTFLRQQLEEVVAQHLLKDVPVACLLSTWLDSGILAALACRDQPGRISTYTVALPGIPQNEITHSRQMARHCRSRHHELVIREADALAWLEQGLISLDVPSADAINTYLITRVVADQGIKTALSALGADELFGGYPSHRLMPWLQLLHWLPQLIRQSFLQRVSPQLANKLSGLPHWDNWHVALAMRRWASDRELAAASAEPLQWPASTPHRITQAWGQTSWAEHFGHTEPMLLRDSQAISMAFGLELRMPYLDHQLVEIALRMPQRFQRPGKLLLRQACNDLFPPGYLDRPHQGFNLPMEGWMRGPLQELCNSRLEALQQSGWLDPAWISKQWQVFEAGQLNWSRAWTLVVLGEFSLRDLTS